MIINIEYMLKLSNITKSFNSDLFRKEFIAVDNLSFSINSGKVIGFLGANGAGKTTTMKMLMDFIRPTTGEIIYSKELGKNKNEILSNIGFLPERPYFYPHLTGRDFCFYMGQLSGLKKTKIIEQINIWAPIFKIDFALDRAIRNYSKGMLQRIGFLVTLLHNPKLIILDEPLSGLDPVGRKELKEVITTVNKAGKTVFFSSHIISDVEEVCEEVVFIKKGKLFYEGSVANIIKEHSKDESVIVYEKDNEIVSLKTSNDEKNQKLLDLISANARIIKVENDKPSLEEIVYNVK
jgi:ABC-2 type transport system ATP-binding protein